MARNDGAEKSYGEKIITLEITLPEYNATAAAAAAAAIADRVQPPATAPQTPRRVHRFESVSRVEFYKTFNVLINDRYRPEPCFIRAIE